MIPLSDGISARRLPIVNVAIIVANFAVWLFYELPHLQSSVFHASFYPCIAHVGGFVFGVIVALVLSRLGQVTPQDGSAAARAPA